MPELKKFAMKTAAVLIIAPLAGWLFLRFIEKFEKDWKSGNRKKRWMILSGVFILLAGIGGWLR
jgi:hypothetical protein